MLTSASTIAIAFIRTDGGTQPRESIDAAVVAEYANDLANGSEFPPVVVFFDGTDYWLADGFHRHGAAVSVGRIDIAADVHQGTQRDAILFSAGANADHGKRRTNADKRRAVERLLADAEWSTWSDREIAKRCGVSPDTVGRIRPQGSLSDSDSESAARTYTTRHGTTATMKTAAIGRTRHVTADAQDVPDDDGQGDDGDVGQSGDYADPLEQVKDDGQLSRAEYGKRLASGTEPLPVQAVEMAAVVEKPQAAAPTSGDDFGHASPQEKRERPNALDPPLAQHNARSEPVSAGIVNVVLSKSAKASAVAIVSRFKLPFLKELLRELQHHIERLSNV